jgi:hypothetical protein
MEYFESPSEPMPPVKNVYSSNSIFLAGSITGASDWQSKMAGDLGSFLNVFNPRRKNFDVNNPKMEREQITWEFKCLGFCDHIMFYFGPETLAPITLFEYGKWLNESKNGIKKLYICIHPEYKRKNDIIIQTELENPDLCKNIVFKLSDLKPLIIARNMQLFLNSNKTNPL